VLNRSISRAWWKAETSVSCSGPPSAALSMLLRSVGLAACEMSRKVINKRRRLRPGLGEIACASILMLSVQSKCIQNGNENSKNRRDTPGEPGNLSGKAILAEITTGRSRAHVIATRLLFRSVANGCRTLDHDDILPSLGDKPPCSRSCRDRSD